MENQEPKKKSFLRTAIPFVAVVVLAYFVNVEVQTFLGKKALKELDVSMISFEQALAQAGTENKLVLADLSAIWCPSCRSFDKNILANERVQETIGKAYVFSRIEYESDEGEAFMERYQVRGFPTLVVIKANGDLVEVLPRVQTAEDFVQLLEKHQRQKVAQL